MSNLYAKWRNIKNRLKENSCENLIWLINFPSYIAGFPLSSKKLNVPFWLIHTALLVYVYIFGAVMYQMYFVDGFIDAIKNFFNIYMCVLVIVISCWQLLKRGDLNYILTLVKKNDDLVIASGRFIDKHQKLLKNIKIIILLCFMFHVVNDILIFIPSRILSMDKFSIVSCVGMEPVTSSPNQEICMFVLTVQVLTCIVVVSSYDVILLFLFSHTTSIFLILYEEMNSFQEAAAKCDGSKEMRLVVQVHLKNIAMRHKLVLHTVKELQHIYNVTIGIGFVLNALTLCLFFVLPLDVCLNFAPLIYHCLFVFFLYCFQGQRLTTASEKFEFSLYTCGWENFHVQEQKYILLMLTVAQKPVILYAANVIPIRIYTFAYTMQSIYKFVTIFKI